MQAPLTKEEKQLEIGLDSLVGKVQDVKNQMMIFIAKLETEYETVTWPSMLDSFALLSSQLNSLKQLLKGDKMPTLRNFAVFPVLLSHDPDADLEKLTEGRVVSCNHDLVPNYLRTKLDPDVEEKVSLIANKAANMNHETSTKQVNTLNKITSNLLDIINSANEEWETEANQKGTIPTTSSPQDTTILVGAVTKGLLLRRPDTINQPQMTAGHVSSVSQSQHARSGIGKTPSSIKTNIKSASHPYSRH